jgi:DNA-binding CsgD family transcriptional regulator
VQKLTNQTLLMKLPALTVQARVSARMQMPHAKQLLALALENASATGQFQYMIPARFSFIEYYWLNASFIDNASQKAEIHISRLCQLPQPILNTWQVGELQVWIKRFDSATTCTSSLPLPMPYEHELAEEYTLAFDAWWQLNMPFNAAMCILNVMDSMRPKALEKAYSIADSIEAKAITAWVRATVLRENLATTLPKVRRGPYAKTKQRPMGLTAKEQYVLKLVVTGASNQKIAEKLSRSNRTVENHVSSILGKLQVDNRIEAMLRVQNAPWLSD